MEGYPWYHALTPISAVIAKVLVRWFDESFPPAANPDCEFHHADTLSWLYVLSPEPGKTLDPYGRYSVNIHWMNNGMNDKMIWGPMSHFIEWGSAKVSTKSASKCSGSRGHRVSSTTHQIYLCSRKAAIDNAWEKGYGCIPGKLYSWILKLAFHTVFLADEILL